MKRKLIKLFFSAETVSLLFLFFLLSTPSFSSAEVQTYAVIGDAGRWNSSSQVVRDSLLQSRIRHLILPGDNYYDVGKSYEQIWGPWSKAGLLFDIVALGNHTLSYSQEIKYFHLRGEYYSVANGDVRWIVLNSDNTGNVNSQMQWFETELREAKESFIFVVFHHPPYTTTSFHSWREKAKFQMPFRKLLWKFRTRITALLVGHDHIASLIALNEIPMIVSGAVQEQRPERPLNYIEDNVHFNSMWAFRGKPHWARLDINTGAAPQVWLNFVDAAKNTIDCSARIFPKPILLRDNCAKTGLR